MLDVRYLMSDVDVERERGLGHPSVPGPKNRRGVLGPSPDGRPVQCWSNAGPLGQGQTAHTKIETTQKI